MREKKNRRNKKSKNYDTIVRTYKFLAFPKNSTKKYLNHVFDASRDFWNMAHQERLDAYRKRKIIFLTYGLPIDRSLPKEAQAVSESQDNCIKYIKDIFPEYSDINTGVFSSVIKQLDTAWINGYKTLRRMEHLYEAPDDEVTLGVKKPKKKKLVKKKKSKKNYILQEDSEGNLSSIESPKTPETEENSDDRFKFNEDLKGANLRVELPENHPYVNSNHIEFLKFVPRFRKKSDSQSFSLKSGGWRVEGDKLYIMRNKEIKSVIKFRKYREMEGILKTVSVIHDNTHRWWVVFTCNEIPKKQVTTEFPEESVGIDFGTNNVLSDSDGNIIKNPEYLQRLTILVANAQRRLDKYKDNPKSKEYIQAKKWLAIYHKKVADKRKNDACEKAKLYTNTYKTICLEDIDLPSILKHRKTPMEHIDGNPENNDKRNLKKRYDAGIGVYRDKIIQRAEYYGNTIVKVPAYYTSQTCSRCGYCRSEKKERLKLSDREYVCPKCGLKEHRDINAALVIKKKGLEILKERQKKLEMTD